MIVIRRATGTDLLAITEIYNEAILTTTATFDTEPKTVADRAEWLAGHRSRHAVIVAEATGNVVGWASLSAWSMRPAYADTAEVSLYVRAAQRGQGIGARLMATILAEGQQAEFHSILARVADGNEASLRVHRNQRDLSWWG